MADTDKAQDIQQERAASPTSQEPEIKKEIKVDTLHNDEAMKVLANYDGEQEWTAEEEKIVRRKIDKKLLPILCLTYALQYYDKGEFCRVMLVLSSSCHAILLLTDLARPLTLSQT